jgi:hypothetical protein
LDDIVKRSNIKNGDINFFEFDEFAIDSWPCVIDANVVPIRPVPFNNYLKT